MQIGDENVHRVRALMDEVFGDENLLSQLSFEKTSSTVIGELVLPDCGLHLWYAKDVESGKYRQLFRRKISEKEGTVTIRVESTDGEVRGFVDS